MVQPGIICYFMTVPEAVNFVMLAGTYARGGVIFAFYMGSLAQIDTLTRNLIKLSNFKPVVDIKIVYSGLHLGEKFFEEYLMAEEGLSKADNNLIHVSCPSRLTRTGSCRG